MLTWGPNVCKKVRITDQAFTTRKACLGRVTTPQNVGSISDNSSYESARYIQISRDQSIKNKRMGSTVDWNSSPGRKTDMGRDTSGESDAATEVLD
jgi:hypothetical protein